MFLDEYQSTSFPLLRTAPDGDGHKAINISPRTGVKPSKTFPEYLTLPNTEIRGVRFYGTCLIVQNHGGLNQTEFPTHDLVCFHEIRKMQSK